MAETKPKNFRVIIVGGSIAGLTLAHCLVHHGIDFVVLEGRDEIAPQEGASISIYANASLAVDQLGILDDILAEVEPLEYVYNWSDKGKLLSYLTTPGLSELNHGYINAFLERRKILQIFYKHLGDRQNSVLTSKRVTRVEHTDTHVVAHCEDGSSFQGDIVIGADGVRSKIRSEMWDHMDTRGLQKEAQKERERMTCEYDCLFGIASPVPGLKVPDIHRTYGEGWCILTVAGKHDAVYFFLFTKLDRKYKSHEIPRFNHAEMDQHAAPYLDRLVSDKIRFSEVYKRAETRNWVPLEEALYENWSTDRFACVGDASHKMTPNAGFGANSAIESSVALTNSIASMLKEHPEPKTEDIDRTFKEWETARKERLIPTWDIAAMLCRLETQASLKFRILKYLIQPMTTLTQRGTTDGIAGGEAVSCLPFPERSFKGLVPWKCHDNLSSIVKEKTWQRVLAGLSLLGFTGLAFVTMVPAVMKVIPQMEEIAKLGSWTTSTGGIVNLQPPLFNLKTLDELVRPMITFFLPAITGSDVLSRAQVLPFINDVNGVVAIWSLESYRKVHTLPAPLLPILMGALSQLGGIGVFGPVYYFFQYLQVSLLETAFANYRETEPTTTYTLLFASLAGQYIPCLTSFFAPALESRKWWNALWQIYPITVPLLQLPLNTLLNPKSEGSAEPKARIQNRQKSLTAVRVAYGSIATVSALGFLYSRYTAPAGSSALSIFWPGLMNSGSSFEGDIAWFFKWDQIISTGAGFTWLALRFRELKRSGAEFSWWKGITGLVGTTCAFGPGAAFALGWGLKEELVYKVGLRE
ncbi:Monooxygenase FAD-binding [Penicillium malachiteum]|uniref:Monooxygenase FAD-binding n=1 Tax=Penicillium malachiteum TaxID=1324776 RepID=UPI0025494402|nr:Monooxygenase FAD-binding [Penicillium malachiteum]KAJ5731602.1 Monooxygenase FAD-binding [Penicillium malachiteum]